MIFLNSASSAAALVFYLPFRGPSVRCTHQENRERPESGMFFSNLMNTLYIRSNTTKSNSPLRFNTNAAWKSLSPSATKRTRRRAGAENLTKTGNTLCTLYRVFLGQYQINQIVWRKDRRPIRILKHPASDIYLFGD